jgi:hypothetical protein
MLNGARWAALWAALALTALPALRPGDVAVADAIWVSAGEEAPGDLTARVWLDAARVNRQVAPWQPGWGRAQARLRELADARRAALPHDRGGRRDER